MSNHQVPLDSSAPPRCTHGALHHGSGGYYLMCLGCGQTWVAKRLHTDSDTDLDRQGTSQTPLAGSDGHYAFLSGMPRHAR